MSHNNLGALLSQTGDPVGARNFFGQALDIQQRLADANPSVAELQRDVAMSHNNIGAMFSQTGDLAGARVACGKALLIQQKLAEANPSVTAFQIELARSHYNIGIVLSRTGDPAAALTSHGQAACHPAETGGRKPERHGVPAKPGEHASEHRQPALGDRRRLPGEPGPRQSS